MIFRFIPGGSGEKFSPVCPEASALLVKTKEWGMLLEIAKKYSFSFWDSTFMIKKYKGGNNNNRATG